MIKLLINKIDGYNYYLNDVNSGDVSLKAESAIFISGGDKNAK